MTDEELIARLRGWARDIQAGSKAIWAMDQDLKESAARIEQLATARRDAEEAEAYAGELEAKLAKVEVLMSAGFAEYERRLSKVKEAFRRNMMQAHPAYTHAQFDKDYEEMMAEP